ncbi:MULTISPECIES: LysR family transcriptional regulator [unclassified Variovorax]|uniref:LysR family transcriptional regulator n=1 Tax=unclassified Variovorax TaxID=663243 RepID=UPI000D11C997|nr:MULTISPECIES: LysR family transcriptional regulator [unclassified Variovorax]AVQ81545.1 LysR family transcriptional regulator [Variovorax sp. PMC12]QRY34450.1 LysR family transcriptional regulator [Variovorax sp. PDNC026]
MRGIRNTLEKTLNLDQLRSFVLVIETGSFSAAADRLGISQPAVSLQVRQLERRLSVRLIERVGKRAKATPAGMELLRHAQHIGSAVENAVDALADHASGVTGRVRLGTGATACLHFLPAVLRTLREQFPALSVVVSTGNTEDQARKVEENSLDLALVTLPAAGRALAAMPVLEDEFVAIGRADVAPLKARVAPADLGALPLVLFEPAANTRKLVDRWFAADGLQPQPVMELGSVEAMKEMVAAGLGYAIVPGMSMAGRGAHPELKTSRLNPRMHRTLAVVLRRDKPVSKALRVVLDAIVAAGKPGRR